MANTKFETQFLLNGNCKIGQHEKCKGISRGTKSDPVHFQCTCPCHPWNKGAAPAPEEAPKG